MNKNNLIFDILRNQDKNSRYVISTPVGLFCGQIEFRSLENCDQETSVYDLVVLKNGYLQQGKNITDLGETYVFLNDITSISMVDAE